MERGKWAPWVWLACVAGLLALSIVTGSGSGPGPAWYAGAIVTALLLIAAAVIRVRAVPNFTAQPGGLQLFLEQLTAMADGFVRGLRAVGRGLIAACVGLAKGARALCLGTVALGRKIAAVRLSAREKKALAVWLACIAALLIASVAVGSHGAHEDIQVAMRDAVLHDVNRVSLFGLKTVNPALIAAMTVTGVLLAAAALIRIFVIPRFREIPGKFQMLLETAVSTLDGLAGVPEPGRVSFVGAYVFAAGVYVFVGTLFELFGLQAVTAEGRSVALPAPLSDVNAAICMGCLSYLVILGGGVARRGLKGLGRTLKEFSLPISMSFRLFGALLSGLLVTELVYHYAALSYGVPVVVGVLFTLLHALIQTYVLTMLVGIYYAEVTE